MRDDAVVRAIAFALLVAVATLVEPGAGDAQQDPVAAMRAIRVKPPAVSPALTFQTLDGQPTRLDALRGRPVMLTFFSTT